MRKVLVVLIILSSLTLTGCTSAINDWIYEASLNIEIDHFEPTTDERIEFLLNSDEEIDFKDYMNRVTDEGIIVSKDRFSVLSDDFDISKVGSYDITYHFMSMEETVEYELTVYVVEELSK